MTNDPLNQIETIATLSVPRYAPRLRPTPIPVARWNDEPLFCLKVNDEWVSHILGVMTALDQPDTWQGEPEEIYDARQQVNEIMVAFMEDCNPMDNCCPEPNRTRWDEDGNYEISYDGGETWVSGNDSDPRYTSPQYPPLSGDDGAEKRCAAANSVVSEIELKVAAWEDLLELGTSFIEFGLAAIAALAVGIFAPAAVPFIFGACLAILKSLWSSSVEDYGDAFTSGVYDDLLCIVFCEASPDGTFTESAIIQIISDIGVTFAGNTIARDAFTVAFRGWGAVGTSNAAVINGGSRSCDGCTECPEPCANNWQIRNADESVLGHIVEQTDEYVIAESTGNIGAAFYIDLTTTLMGSADVCCYMTSFEVLESSSAVGLAVCNCGTFGDPSITISTEGCFTRLQPQSANYFKIKFNFGECP